MRLSEDKIKQAILHSEEEVRLPAVAYFSRSSSQDDTVMPLVIEAVERYGRKKSFSILRRADDLRQTAATIRWLADELSKNWDLEDVKNDNYCCAIALVLHGADPRLLKPELAELRCFPEELQDSFHERLDMAAWDWETGWAALEQFGREGMQRASFTMWDIRRGARLVESLSRHRNMGDSVEALLARDYRGKDRTLMEWLEPSVVELAGKMRLDAAVPAIMERLHEDDFDLPESALNALRSIGNERVVAAIAVQWSCGGEHFRDYASEALGDIHTDLSVKVCLDCFRAEENEETRDFLAHALLGNFAYEAVEPIRHMVVGDSDDLDPELMDLRHRLAFACALMGVSFPEYDTWLREAVVNATDWSDFSIDRIRHNFREDEDDGAGFFEPDWDDQFDPEMPPLFEPPEPRLLDSFESRPEPPDMIESGRKHVGRNDPCPCGSGKKFKKCCIRKQSGSVLE